MGSKKTTQKDSRSRNWTAILYPESAPKDWKNLLDDFHIEIVLSPLHDKDINANGEAKKPHYHVLFLFGGVKAYEQVLEVTEILNCTRPERCHNAKALVRYMIHLDNPEKAQYSVSDIISYGGVDVAELLRPSSSERYSIINEMITYIQENSITEIQDLIDYARYNEFERWFPLLCDNSAYILNQYIKSQRHRTTPQNNNTA